MDAYGRYVPTQDGKKTDKEVGMFYFCWLGSMDRKLYDIQKMLDENPNALWDATGPDESPLWGFHFWASRCSVITTVKMSSLSASILKC